jgi:hypothetical protein
MINALNATDDLIEVYPYMVHPVKAGWGYSFFIRYRGDYYPIETCATSLNAWTTKSFAKRRLVEDVAQFNKDLKTLRSRSNETHSPAA